MEQASCFATQKSPQTPIKPKKKVNDSKIVHSSWYKLDQFGYEALAEAFVSLLLEKSNLERDTPFSFVRYRMETIHVHGLDRTGCSSPNFLEPGQSLITINRLLSSVLGFPLKQKLARLPRVKQRIAYLSEFTAE